MNNGSKNKYRTKIKVEGNFDQSGGVVIVVQWPVSNPLSRPTPKN